MTKYEALSLWHEIWLTTPEAQMFAPDMTGLIEFLSAVLMIGG